MLFTLNPDCLWNQTVHHSPQSQRNTSVKSWDPKSRDDLPLGSRVKISSNPPRIWRFFQAICGFLASNPNQAPVAACGPAPKGHPERARPWAREAAESSPEKTRGAFDGEFSGKNLAMFNSNDREFTFKT